MRHPLARLVIPAAAMLAIVGHGDRFEAADGLRLEYQIHLLDTLGGSSSRANSLNNLGLAAGYSYLPDDSRQRAMLWFYGLTIPLGTFGGPNSNVPWPVKNVTGVVAGIAQTNEPTPENELWSCRGFFPAATRVGKVCLGFVWEWGHMRRLRTLGGPNGFATGVNNHRQIVGWAENLVRDPTCDLPVQTFQFLPVVWSGPAFNRIRPLPLLDGDSAGAATAINDLGQIVGISGECDQAVGRDTAKHAVLWENGEVKSIGTLGGRAWHTPMAINRHGVIAGFGDLPGDVETRAFRWTREGGIENLGVLEGHGYSEAHGINDRGQIVGVSCQVIEETGALTDCRAFLWENHVMRDLNALRAPDDTEHLATAMDINDFGAVAGRAVLADGKSAAFVAVPTIRWDASSAEAEVVAQGAAGDGDATRSATAATAAAAAGGGADAAAAARGGSTRAVTMSPALVRDAVHPLGPGRARMDALSPPQ